MVSHTRNGDARMLAYRLLHQIRQLL